MRLSAFAYAHFLLLSSFSPCRSSFSSLLLNMAEWHSNNEAKRVTAMGRKHFYPRSPPALFPTPMPSTTRSPQPSHLSLSPLTTSDPCSSIAIPPFVVAPPLLLPPRSRTLHPRRVDLSAPENYSSGHCSLPIRRPLLQDPHRPIVVALFASLPSCHLAMFERSEEERKKRVEEKEQMQRPTGGPLLALPP